MTNAKDDDLGSVRSVENQIGIWAHDNAANIVLVGGAPSLWIIGKQIKDGLKPPFDVNGALRRSCFNVV